MENKKEKQIIRNETRGSKIFTLVLVIILILIVVFGLILVNKKEAKETNVAHNTNYTQMK